MPSTLKVGNWTRNWPQWVKWICEKACCLSCLCWDGRSLQEKISMLHQWQESCSMEPRTVLPNPQENPSTAERAKLTPTQLWRHRALQRPTEEAAWQSQRASTWDESAISGCRFQPMQILQSSVGCSQGPSVSCKRSCCWFEHWLEIGHWTMQWVCRNQFPFQLPHMFACGLDEAVPFDVWTCCVLKYRFA